MARPNSPDMPLWRTCTQTVRLGINSGAPLLSKFGKYFGGDVSVRAPARPYRLWGRGGEGSPKTTQRRAGGVTSFLGGVSRGAFGQPVFLLAGNRMTTVALKRRLFLKAQLVLQNDSVRQK